ncbi:PQQ-binding-like beta-propeller repeat protein [Blastococcus sp. CT_GayMR16]|uniref:outer membrane protein assembly factor BamB family protein n=1 Tax=Blastococcus sp. CT_GayMR16 TaxID=2559607 RepID=UPI001FD7B877|nr:PQQ-binding-like beta-propeller repeat protein [Blastococcus sp. CT_GayMR16]
MLVWAAATVVLLLVAVLLWRGSDAAATESTTAPPADVPSGTPAGAVSETWSADGELPTGTVVQSGRVLVGSAHGVRALDPLTGEEAWHYTRSNARLCGLTATNGLAVAVFATADRCDEAVALNAGTGVRAWTRSVRFADDATLTSTDRIVLASNPTGIVTIDPTGDNIRWRYAAPAGCRFLGTAAGSAGIAVLQRCAGATLAQVRLFDGFSGEAHWSRDVALPEGGEIRLLGADALPTLLVDGEVQALTPADGTVLARLPVPEGADVQVGPAGTVTLVRVDGRLLGLDATGATLWDLPALGLPAAPGIDKDTRGPAALLVPEDGAFVQRDPTTGAALGRSEAADLPEDGVATSIGPVVVLRLPDRVLGYR